MKNFDPDLFGLAALMTLLGVVTLAIVGTMLYFMPVILGVIILVVLLFLLLSYTVYLFMQRRWD